MKISICCDHGAVALKNTLRDYLTGLGHEVQDFGTHTTASCDYPDIVAPALAGVADGTLDRGIVLCTTGIGMSIAANKVKDIRCALVGDSLTARMTRQHNDTNVLAMGAGIVGENLAKEIATTWLDTPFSNEERHVRRLAKLAEMENK